MNLVKTKLVLSTLVLAFSVNSFANLISCVVHYGDGKYISKKLMKSPFPHKCSNGAFGGDPVPGKVKACYIGSEKVASENGQFAIPAKCPSGNPPVNAGVNLPSPDATSGNLPGSNDSTQIGAAQAAAQQAFCAAIRESLKREGGLIVDRINGKQPLEQIAWSQNEIGKLLMSGKMKGCK